MILAQSNWRQAVYGHFQDSAPCDGTNQHSLTQFFRGLESGAAIAELAGNLFESWT
jgi:hypothetical protein